MPMSDHNDEAGGAVLAAVQTVDVERLPALRDALAAAGTLGAQVERLHVTDAISAETATALLGQVVAARRHAEAQRIDLTKPLRGVVDKINAAAKRTIEPLVAVEATLKGHLLAYQREQQRLADEEHARQVVEAERRRAAEEQERRRVEEAARVEREAAARAAAQAEAAQRQAREDAARREREDTDALTAKLRAATDEQLLKARASGTSALAALAAKVLDERAAARELEATAAAARAREEAARLAEEQARSAVAMPIAAPAVVAPTPLTGGGARVATRKTWDYEVVDFAKIPDRFKEITKGEVRAAIREGARDVPGLRIFQAESASVTL
jgi:hypothetical protein